VYQLIALGVCFPAESIFYDKRVYFEEARVFFDILEELDDSVTDVAIIGHNPELTAFAQYFLNDLSVVMSPSAMIGIEINSDNWSKIKQAVYKKLFIITP
jgi:phosphohistidine phosphatase SixA